MSKAGFAGSLAVLFLASALLGQESGNKTPVPTAHDCEPNTCISKVLYLPNFSTAGELQEVVNTFRAVLGFTNIYPKQSDHTIALKDTPEQVAVAEKLLSVLESLRSSGGHERSSVFVYQLKGRLSGTAEAERFLGQHPEAASKHCDLNTCYVKAMYLPDLSTPQLGGFMERVRATANLPYTMAIPSRHVLVIRGTSEQVAIAASLLMNTSAPQ